MKIKVENMNCMHCVATIQKALIQNGIFAKIDLPTKTIIFNSETDRLNGIEVIKEAGFSII